MVTFNPNANLDQSADYSRASQGSKADTSAGTALEGLAQAVGGFVPSLYRDVKERLREEATANVDDIQNMYILSGIMPGKKGTNEDSVLPKEIQEARRKGTIMSDAVAAGKMAHSSYSMMLDASARRLRAQYPGFREEIDNIYQDLTGSIPANKVMSDLFHEAAGKKGSEEAEYRHQLHWAQTHGTPELALAHKENRNLSLNELTRANTAHGYKIARMDLLSKSYNLEEKETESGYRQADKLAREALFNPLTGGISAIFNRATNGQADQVLRLSDRITSDVQSGKIPSQQDTTSLQVAANAMRITGEKQFNDQLDAIRTDANGKKFTIRGILKDDQRRALETEFRQRMDEWVKPFISGDAAQITAQARWIKAVEDGGKGTFYSNTKWAPVLNAGRHAMGDQAFNSVMVANPAMLGAVAKSLSDQTIGEIVATDSPVADQIKKLDTYLADNYVDAKEGKKAKQEVINGFVKMMTDPQAKVGGVEQLARKLYTTLGASWFDDIKDPKDREAVYVRMTDPRITERLTKANSIEVREGYKTWVAQYGGGLLANKADTAKSTIVESPTPYSISFDPKTITFQPANTASVPGQGDVNYSREGQLRDKYVAELNKVVTSWAAVMERSGFDKPAIAAEVQRIFKSRGVDITNGPVQTKGEGAKPKAPAYRMFGMPQSLPDEPTTDNTK